MKKVFLLDMLLYSITVSAQFNREQRSVFQRLLNDFCEEYYRDCFSGRQYVSKSLTVTDVQKTSTNTVRVDGYHEYLNYIDIADKQPYYAEVYINQDSGYLRITFHKESEKKNWFAPDYWESCSKEGNINE
jgi:N-glycosylase/DNA lyase